MSSIEEMTSPVSATGEIGQLPPRDLAAPGRRLGAFLVDIVLLTALTAPLLVPAILLRNDHRKEVELAQATPGPDQVAALPFWTSGWFVGIVLAVVFGLYRVPQVAGLGRTLGHRVFGLRVVDFTGRRKVRFGRALLRYLTFYGINAIPVLGPSFTFVNYAWCIFDKPYRQCLHDKVAGTFVVHPSKRPATPEPTPAWSPPPGQLQQQPQHPQRSQPGQPGQPQPAQQPPAAPMQRPGPPRTPPPPPPRAR